jgi:hypothetical protein
MQKLAVLNKAIMGKHPELSVSRRSEIVAQFRQILDNHLNDLLAGRVDKVYQSKEIAAIICLDSVHLSKMARQETGHHARHFMSKGFCRKLKFTGRSNLSH